MSTRVKPAKPPSKLAIALLCIVLIAIGFATLMVRLEVTQEGYQLSALRDEGRRLEEENRRLRLAEAERSSSKRLRELAPSFGLVPPARGQVVTAP